MSSPIHSVSSVLRRECGIGRASHKANPSLCRLRNQEDRKEVLFTQEGSFTCQPSHFSPTCFLPAKMPLHSCEGGHCCSCEQLLPITTRLSCATSGARADPLVASRLGVLFRLRTAGSSSLRPARRLLFRGRITVCLCLFRPLL